MRRLLLAFVLLAMPAGAQERMVIGTVEDGAPYVSRTATMEMAGLDVDVAEEVCRRAGLRCEWRVAPFAELLPGLDDGRWDAAMAGLGDTAYRAARYGLSVPYQRTRSTYLRVVAERGPREGPVAVLAGSLHEGLVAPGDALLALPDIDAVLDAVASGRAREALGGAPLMERAAWRPGLRVAEELPLPDIGTVIAMRMGDPRLPALDRAIRSMAADGTLDRLHALWFGRNQGG